MMQVNIILKSSTLRILHHWNTHKIGTHFDLNPFIGEIVKLNLVYNILFWFLALITVMIKYCMILLLKHLRQTVYFLRMLPIFSDLNLKFFIYKIIQDFCFVRVKLIEPGLGDLCKDKVICCKIASLW